MSISHHVIGCQNVSIIGDGYCNDETNIPDCNYDGGDCCGSSCVNKEFCIDCLCLDDGNYLLADRICHDFPGLIKSVNIEGYFMQGGLTWNIQYPNGHYIIINFLKFDIGQNEYSYDTSCDLG